MNKTKILTSLSALAAVFVFNGNAMAAAAGVYNPSCSGNEYTITITYAGIDIVNPSEGECRSGEVCIPKCPANNSVYTYIYGDADSYSAPGTGCSGSHNYNGWKLQGVDVKLNGQAVTFSDVSIAAGAEIEDEYFVVGGKVVDTESTFKLVPAGVSAKTVSVQLQCTHADDGLPSVITPIVGTYDDTGNVGGTISFAKNCSGTDGYTISAWQYKLEGSDDDNWTTVVGNTFTIPDIGDAASATYLIRPRSYVPGTYNMVLKKGLNGDTVLSTLKYTNPIEDAAGTWKDEQNLTVTSGVGLPTLAKHTLRGMVKSDAHMPVVVKDDGRLNGDVILRSSATSDKSATLPDLGIVTENGTFYPAWAKNCEPVESAGGLPTASCVLELTPATGAVTYTNRCEPGFNTLKPGE